MPAFVEISDKKTLATSIQQLTTLLQGGFTHVRNCTVTAPSGSFPSRSVRFLHASKVTTGWLAVTLENRFANFFVQGSAASTEPTPLDIELEINIAKHVEDRKVGGFFVRDDSTGHIHLAHRGLFNRRRGRIPKKWVFEAMGKLGYPAVTVTINGKPEKAFVLGRIDRPALIKTITVFASKVREMKDRRDEWVEAQKSAPLMSSTRPGFQSEFSGTSQKSGSDAFDVDHGRIVDALRDALIAQGFRRVANTKAIDLMCIAPKSPHHYVVEVKTDITSQSLYTGIGQLLVSNERMRTTSPGKRTVLTLVLPRGRLEAEFQTVLDNQGIWVCRYWKSKGQYRFDLLTKACAPNNQL